jgi:hypothetical protein
MAGDNKQYYSLDGQQWTEVSAHASVVAVRNHAVAYNGTDLWLVVGGLSGVSNCAYSVDTITSTSSPIPILTEGSGVAHSGVDKCVVCGGGSSDSLVYSSDGLTWTGSGRPLSVVHDVVYGAGVFVAVGTPTWPNDSRNVYRRRGVDTDRQQVPGLHEFL